MGFRPMFLVDAGESKQLVPLKLFILSHNFCYSLFAYLPVYFLRGSRVLQERDGGSHGHSVRLHGRRSAVLGKRGRYASPPQASPCVVSRHRVATHFLHPVRALVPSHVCRSLRRVLPDADDTGIHGSRVDEAHDSSRWRVWQAAALRIVRLRRRRVCVRVGSVLLRDYVVLHDDARRLVCVVIDLLFAIPAGYGDEDLPEQKHNLQSILHHLAGRSDVLVLYAVALAAGVMRGLFDNFLFVNVYDLSGDGATIVSAFVVLQTSSEIPVFFLASTAIQWLGTAASLAIVVAAYCIRDITYSFMEQPWHVMPVEVFHGVAYGLLVTSLIKYIYAAAPEGATGTMIGLLSAVQCGVGAGIASLGGGCVYDTYGARTMWRISAFGIAPVALVLVGIFAWRKRVVTAETKAVIVEGVETLPLLAKD